MNLKKFYRNGGKKLSKLILTIESENTSLLDQAEKLINEQWGKLPKEQTLLKVNVKRE